MSSEACVAEQERHREINAIFADLLDKKVIGFFGSAGFAENCQFTISASDDRLDAQDAAGKCGCSGDPAAFFQIFESIDHSDKTDLIPLF